MSKVLWEDMEQIVADSVIPWDEIRNSTVLVTGATGTIGSALVRALFAANQKHKLGVKVLACGRDREKAGLLTEKYGAETFLQDIREPFKIDGPVNYIFHGAAVTRSSEMAADPVGVIETSLMGTSHVLALAKAKQVQSMVYISSMEVYGRTDPALSFVTEDIMGTIDLQAARSCYPESKRMCECLCNCWYTQYGIPVKTARLVQTFGAGTASDDPRVFAQLARKMLAGENIVLHTEGRSQGNYCYLSDTVRGLILLLLKGQNGEAYNIANPEASMTIREMAEMVAARLGGGKVSVIIDKPPDIEKYGYAPVATGQLSAEKVERLGWKPQYGLEQMYRRMILDWQENEGRGVID